MSPSFKPERIIVVLGDQLDGHIAALKCGHRDRDLVLMAEVIDEASYVPHHKKKLAFIFSAMRHFANQLIKEGWNVRYVRLNEQQNTGSIVGEIQRALTEFSIRAVVQTEASEFRVSSEITTWANSFSYR